MGEDKKKYEIDDIVTKILDDYNDDRIINKVELFDQPDKEVIIEMIDKLMKIIYPGFFR